MKFVINRKSIIVLIICFIFLLIAFLGLIFKDRISQIISTKTFYNLDKYSELLQDCEIEKDKGLLKLHCKAVLKDIKTKNEEDCILVEVLVEDDKDLRDSTLCIKKDSIDWENPYAVENAFLPVEMVLDYKRGKIFNYSLDKIKLTILDDNELFKLFELNSNLKKLRPRILTKELADIRKNNYNSLDSVSVGGANLDFVLFYNFILKSITLDDSTLELLMEGEIKGQRYNVLFKSKRFLNRIDETGRVSIVTSDNFSDLEINKEYDFMTVSSNTIVPESILKVVSIWANYSSTGYCKRFGREGAFSDLCGKARKF